MGPGLLEMGGDAGHRGIGLAVREARYRAVEYAAQLLLRQVVRRVETHASLGTTGVEELDEPRQAEVVLDVEHPGGDLLPEVLAGLGSLGDQVQVAGRVHPPVPDGLLGGPVDT